MEIAADSRETGINWSEIATYSQEIGANIQLSTFNFSSLTPAAPPPAAVEWPQTAHFPLPLFPPDLPKTTSVSEMKAAYFCKGKFPVLSTAKRVLKLRRK
jgi:hypothetical protein